MKRLLYYTICSICVLVGIGQIGHVTAADNIIWKKWQKSSSGSFVLEGTIAYVSGHEISHIENEKTTEIQRFYISMQDEKCKKEFLSVREKVLNCFTNADLQNVIAQDASINWSCSINEQGNVTGIEFSMDNQDVDVFSPTLISKIDNIIWNTKFPTYHKELVPYYVAGDGISAVVAARHLYYDRKLITFSLNNDDKKTTITSVNKTLIGDEVKIPKVLVVNHIIYSVTSIADSAFVNCTSLTSVTIPGSVQKPGMYVFYKCI